MVQNMPNGQPSTMRLSVDGGLSLSNILCQIEADILSLNVIRPSEQELSSLGGAVAAAIGAEPDNERFILDSLLRSEAIENVTEFNSMHSNGLKMNLLYLEWKKRLERELTFKV